MLNVEQPAQVPDNRVELALHCHSCGDPSHFAVFQASPWKDEVYVDVYLADEFHPGEGLVNRIKGAWRILTGRRFERMEVGLDEVDLNAIKRWCNDVLALAE